MRLHMAVIMERYVLLILDCQLFYQKTVFVILSLLLQDIYSVNESLE